MDRLSIEATLAEDQIQKFTALGRVSLEMLNYHGAREIAEASSAGLNVVLESAMREPPNFGIVGFIAGIAARGEIDAIESNIPAVATNFGQIAEVARSAFDRRQSSNPLAKFLAR